MARYRGSYSGYRGRRTLNDILRGIAIVLAVLVALVIAGLFFGQRFLVFTDDGVQWPWDYRDRDKEADKSLAPGSVSVVIQPEGSGAASSEEGTEPVQPVQPPTAALALPVSAVMDGTAAQRLEEVGANTLVLEMKDPEGKLGWVSAQAPAQQSGVNSGLEGVNDALRTWNQGDIYTVARVCCFRDNSVPYYNRGMAVRTGGGNWRDELGLRWLSPDSQETRDYLSALCGELAELGFDEILLECCAFPTAGRVDRITRSQSYQDGDFAGTVEGFLDQALAAAAPYGAALSVRVDRGLFSGEESGGLTAAGLESRVDRFWMEQDGLEPSLAQLLTDAGISRADSRLVALVPTLDAAAGIPQAALENP